MGNRAVVVWKDSNGNYDGKSVGVYLHWNGGRDSIEGFLAYCRLCGFRSPSKDDYGLARFVQIVANFFGGDGLSIGVDRIEKLDVDNGDNGLYICQDWEIVGREHFNGEEQNCHNLQAMLQEISLKQPKSLQKSDDAIYNFVMRSN